MASEDTPNENEEVAEAAEETAAEAPEAEVEAADGGGGDEVSPRDDGGDDEIERRPALYLARFETPNAIVGAAEQVRDAGYSRWDVHTPYPVHGMDDAMGLKPTKIGWISMIAAMIGVASAVLMIQWMNGFDYPLWVGGKPPEALPAMVPIMFELGVLLCGISTVFGLFHICRLPRHHHPVFYSDAFAEATDDKFFISIEAEDPQFDLGKTRSLLESLKPTHLELVEEEV